jgi:hypothetical protein
MANPNLQLLTDAAKLLEPILGELVFVGGCSTALLIADNAAIGHAFSERDGKTLCLVEEDYKFGAHFWPYRLNPVYVVLRLREVSILQDESGLLVGVDCKKCALLFHIFRSRKMLCGYHFICVVFAECGS